MVNKTKYFIIIILFFAVSFNFSQVKEKIKNKQTELSRIKTEISLLESQLKIKTTKEKQSNIALDNYNKQNFLLNTLVNRLREEEQLKQEDIEFTLHQIEYIEKEIKILQINYSKYVTSVYKKGKDDELAALLNSESLQQALIRYKYLQKFSEKRVKDLGEFQKNKQELIVLKDKYEKEKEEKVILAEQKENDSKMLQKKLVERKKLLASIRHDKTELKKSINSKRSAESKIKNLIAKLIDTEERKKKEEHERLVKLESAKVRNESRTKSISSEMKDVNNDAVYDINISTSELSSFSSLKGKLNWPVSGGHIVRHFGEDRNAKLNTVTLNYGVDIKAGSDLNIKTPADGVVSAIDWIPGYGGVIIITHKDGYRTVYSHFSEIFVKEGDKVKPGNIIAKVGESIEGFIVHFEIWYSRNNQNPEIWLARK
jgi:septal ring factor EnvC (AmiA/AmiB activator)